MRGFVSALLGVALSVGQAGAGVTIGTAKFGNLFHSADVKDFAVSVTSGSFGFSGWLVTEVRDPYGRLVLQDERPFTAPATASVSERYQITGALNGVYDVTTSALVPLRTSPPAWQAETTIGVVPPPPTPDFDDRSAVGYYLLPDPSELALADDVAQQLQDLGIKWVRMGHQEWALDARAARPDVTDPAWLDTAAFDVWVDALRAHGVQVVAQLFGSARWASSDPNNTTDAGLGPYWRLASPQTGDWDRYVRTMAARFAGRIRHWELWNEPDSSLFFEPTLSAANQRTLAGQRFAQVAQIASSALRSTDPANRVILNLANASSTTFPSAFFPPAGNTFDAFGYHYADGPEVAGARTLLQTSGLSAKALWNTEAYGRSLNPYRPGKDMLPVWFRSRAAGASRLLHFIYHIIYDFDDVAGFREFGEYPVHMDYTPKPLAVAMRTLSDLVGPADFVRSFQVRTDGTLIGYVFDRAGRTVIAVLREGTPGVDVWGSTPGRKVVVKVPAGTGSVTVTDLMSNATTLTSSVGEVALPLDGNPVFVEGVSATPSRPLDFVGYTTSRCGNGLVDPGEQCDDGNAVSGDCCNAACALEAASTTCPQNGIAHVIGSFNATSNADAQDVAIQGDYAYVATDNTGDKSPELSIVSIADPTRPVFVGGYDVAADVTRVRVEGSRAYLGTRQNNRELVVLDVSTKTAPKLVGAYDSPGGSDALALAVVGTRVYLGTASSSGPELFVIDAANPAAIKLLGTYEIGASVNDIDVAGDFAYLATASSTKEFLVLDVSKPNAPAERSAYNVSGNNPGRGIAYHAGVTVGITYNAGSAADFFVLNSPYGGGLQLVSSLNLGTDNSGVAVYGGRAFVSTRQSAQGLRVIDVSTPATPVVRATLSTGDKANAVAVRDSLPFLATSSNTLELQVAHGGIRVEPILTDINGDGLITTSCLGDENTQSPGSPLRFWCDGLDDLVTRPTWRTRNRAAPSATVYPQDAPAPPDGPTQLASALALDAPDAVVLAFGTADIPLMVEAGQLYGVPPPLEAIVLAYRSMVTSAAASQVKTFIALTPPQGTTGPTQTNELVAQLDNRLRHEFPGEQLIDFCTPMIPDQDYLPHDLDHMNQSGQSKRAAAARRELEN